ncbi:MAG: hypothetical protein WD155_08730 [Burkholderiales bacterium]
MRMFAKLKYTLISLYALVMVGRRADDPEYEYISLIGNAQDKLAELARISGRMEDRFRNPLLERMWQEQYCPPALRRKPVDGFEPRRFGRRLCTLHRGRPTRLPNRCACPERHGE